MSDKAKGKFLKVKNSYYNISNISVVEILEVGKGAYGYHECDVEVKPTFRIEFYRDKSTELRYFCASEGYTTREKAETALVKILSSEELIIDESLFER